LAHDGDERPSLVLDAGTGLQRLTRFMEGEPFVGTILLGHLHWDHTHGLPFFGAGDRPDARVHLYQPAHGDPEALLERAMSPPHFPITPSDLRGDWSFGALEPGEHKLEDFTVLAREIPHKGGRTFGYRVADERSSMAYLSDHSPISLGPGPDGFGEYHDAALELAAGVDLLVHDAQYTALDFETKAAFGHSTVDYAVGLAERAGAKRLLLFHHDPPRSDEELDALVAMLVGGPVPVDAAAEGMVIDLPAA
jgi:ribonuclease BN (tRNA processing enzyme)